MKVNDFYSIVNAEFWAGVPDSLLRALCDFLYDTYGIDKNKHIVTANEGNAVALAAGYHLATGKIPAIYMQNSGIGNVINPIASLINEKVYDIPMIFIIGWRGEPGVPDEPQHIFQGEITEKLCKDMNIEYVIVSKETTIEELVEQMKLFNNILDKGKQVAFIIKKGALTYEKKVSYTNSFKLVREEVILHIVNYAKDNPIIATTGKAGRELYEIRDRLGDTHDNDFLTVGSMGHSSSIALGIASNMPNKRIWCIDGDGAALMHMGAMAVIGSSNVNNLIHIVINNGSHETVGGMPTVAEKIDLCMIAKACGYEKIYSVNSKEQLDDILDAVVEDNKLTFLEIKCSIYSRGDLGRPKTSAKENKLSFMKHLSCLNKK